MCPKSRPKNAKLVLIIVLKELANQLGHCSVSLFFFLSFFISVSFSVSFSISLSLLAQRKLQKSATLVATLLGHLVVFRRERMRVSSHAQTRRRGREFECEPKETGMT